MNERISQIITIVLNNRIVCLDTNIQGVYNKFMEVEPNFWNYHKLYRKFQSENYFIFSVDDKEYHIEITTKEKL